MADVITVEEWQAELDRLSQSENDEGLTSAEIQQLLGLSVTKTQLFLKSGIQKGTMQRGKRRVEEDWDGRPRTYIVYRVTK